MSPQDHPRPDDEINKPLPRKSRAHALAWAKEYTSAMAHFAGVRLTEQYGPYEDFETCVGAGGEVADDERYTLTYTVYAAHPRDQHIAATRRLRAALENNGVRITTLTERPETPEVIMYASHPTEGFFLIADTSKPPNTLRLSVTTPCFLPPGAPQQEF